LNKTNYKYLFFLFFVAGGIVYLFNEIDYPSFSILQKETDLMLTLDKQHSLTQTFISVESYFSSICFPVYARGCTDISQSAISFCLGEASPFSRDIACDNLLLPHSTDVEEIDFLFPVPSESIEKRYQISIKTESPPGVIYVWSSLKDAYPYGNFYINDQEMPGDLAFWGYSHPNLLLLIKMFLNSIHRLPLLVEFFALSSICGYFILALASIDFSAATISQRLILSSSVGLAFPPIFLYSLGLFDINLTRRVITGTLLCVAGLILLVRIIRSMLRVKDTNLKNYFQRNDNLIRQFQKITLDQYDIIFLVLFILAVITRLLQIENLFVPNWTDGLAHQNALNVLFASGVVPINQIYHIGFYLNTFFAQSLLGLDSPEATLIFGQWLSVASGMTFYLLAQKFFGNKLVPLICLAFYWFLSPFPSYLISWGRYPILLGMTLLPATIIFSIKWIETKKTNNFFLASLFAVSLLLAHYSIFVIWGISVFSYMIFQKIQNRSKYSNNRPQALSTYKLIAQIGLLLLLLGLFFYPKVKTILSFSVICHDSFPYLDVCIRQIASSSHIFGPTANLNGPLLSTYGNLINVMNQAKRIITDADAKYMLYLTLKQGGEIIWLCGTLGMVFMFRTNRKLFYGIVGWFVFLILFSVIQTLLLAVAVPSVTNIIIFFSIPLTLLCGSALQYFLETKEYTARFRNIILGVLIGLILLGAYGSIGTVNPVTTLFNREDQEAVAWIDQNTSVNDTILINSFYWGSWYVPSDGGGWVSSLTGRNTVSPSSQQEFADIQGLIDTNKVSYIYLGHGYGELQTSMFEKRNFKIVYQKDGISIYKVLSSSNQ